MASQTVSQQLATFNNLRTQFEGKLSLPPSSSKHVHFEQTTEQALNEMRKARLQKYAPLYDKIISHETEKQAPKPILKKLEEAKQETVNVVPQIETQIEESKSIVMKSTLELDNKNVQSVNLRESNNFMISNQPPKINTNKAIPPLHLKKMELEPSNTHSIQQMSNLVLDSRTISNQANISQIQINPTESTKANPAISPKPIAVIEKPAKVEETKTVVLISPKPTAIIETPAVVEETKTVVLNSPEKPQSPIIQKKSPRYESTNKKQEAMKNGVYLAVKIINRNQKGNAFHMWNYQIKLIRTNIIQKAKNKEKAMQFRSTREFNKVKQMFEAFAEHSKSQACWLRRVQSAFILKQAMACFDSWKLYTLYTSFDKIKLAKLQRKAFRALADNVTSTEKNQRIDEKRELKLKLKAMCCLINNKNVKKAIKKLIVQRVRLNLKSAIGTLKQNAQKLRIPKRKPEPKTEFISLKIIEKSGVYAQKRNDNSIFLLKKENVSINYK